VRATSTPRARARGAARRGHAAARGPPEETRASECGSSLKDGENGTFARSRVIKFASHACLVSAALGSLPRGKIERNVGRRAPRRCRLSVQRRSARSVEDAPGSAERTPTSDEVVRGSVAPGVSARRGGEVANLEAKIEGLRAGVSRFLELAPGGEISAARGGVLRDRLLRRGCRRRRARTTSRVSTA
jgi:hypothetical protein